MADARAGADVLMPWGNRPRLSVYERFWAKVVKSEGCWLWTATRLSGKFAYGIFRIGSRNQTAHRVAWQLTYGPIPIGMCVLHRCDNPPCVNPQHLFLGTEADNVRDCENKGRGNHPAGALNGKHTHPESRAHGERNGRAKLTGQNVEEIRCLYASGGHTHRSLARQFGVQRSTIYRLLNGMAWTGVASSVSSDRPIARTL